LNQKGENNSNWSGGECISGGGYASMLRPDHPFCDINKRVKRSRLVMEEHIGRYLLPEEIVHHINRNKRTTWHLGTCGTPMTKNKNRDQFHKLSPINLC
jgi:hypothetical protein